jgi:competence protein ComEA
MEKLFKKYKKIKKYWLEMILLLIAFLITVVSLIVFNINNNQSKDEEVITINQPESQITSPQDIYIDVSGEVTKPNVYKVKSGIRLNEIMDLAGGLSKNADNGFFYRNYNLSRILIDQEKIYVPSVLEIDNGYFTENRQTLDFITAVEQAKPDINIININNASIEELDTLPGIGAITAQKIITNRPYQSVDELLSKKSVNKSVFEKIKGQITIN